MHLLYGEIIAAAWAVFVFVWALTSLRVKRDIRMHWWRSWYVRPLALFLLSFAAAHMALLARGHSLALQALVGRTASFGDGLGALGCALCIGGIALAVWARAHLGRNWSAIPTLKVDHELVVSGPYQLVRHPIYTGILLATFGSGLVIPLWLGMWVVALAIFSWRVRTEERLMLAQFPEQYPAYMKRTWALLPYIY